MQTCNNCCFKYDNLSKSVQNPKKNYVSSLYYCNDCFESVRDEIINNNGEIPEVSIPIRKISYENLEKKNKDLESRVEKLEEELAIERSTNLEMLDNLRDLNERKFNDRLEIALKEKMQRIEFLEKLLIENPSNKRIFELENRIEQLSFDN